MLEILKQKLILNAMKKNHTNVKVGHTSEFPFDIYWWTLKNPKILNFERNEKKCWRYHHVTHVYQKPNHMTYGYWDTEGERIFCHLGPFFALISPKQPRKSKFLKRKKTSRVVIISHLCIKNMIIWCMLTQIWSATDMTFCHCRSFYALLPHYWTQKLKFGKNVKKHLEILSFYRCLP